LAVASSLPPDPATMLQKLDPGEITLI